MFCQVVLLTRGHSVERDVDVYYYICDNIQYLPETEARRRDGEYERLHEGAEGRYSRGTHGHSLHEFTQGERWVLIRFY